MSRDDDLKNEGRGDQAEAAAHLDLAARVWMQHSPAPNLIHLTV